MNERTDLPVVLVVGAQHLEQDLRLVLLSLPRVHLGALEHPGEGTLAQTLILEHTQNAVQTRTVHSVI